MIAGTGTVQRQSLAKQLQHRLTMTETMGRPADRINQTSTMDRRWSISITLVFSLLFLLNLAHHQMWRDELNVWGIVRASPTLSRLAYNIHYEGHPGLWYYLVWFAARLSPHAWAMKLVEAAIGVGICCFIGISSPWSRLEKIFVLTSYYVVFEYTVLSRTYGLCLLIALAYIYLRGTKPMAVVRCSILLGLLANTDIIGVILSGSLLFEYTLYLFRPPGMKSRVVWKKVAVLSLTYTAFLLAAYLTLRPAQDISWVTTGKVGASIGDMHRLLIAVISNLGLPWFPFSLHFPHKFWNPNVLLHPAIFELVSLAVAAALTIIFKDTPRLLVLLGVALIGSIVFAHVVYLGYMRHFGVVFVAFLLAYWLLRATDNRVSYVALCLLAINALGGVEATAGSWLHPFSNSKNTAQWIVQQHLQDLPLAGFPDFSTVGVAEQLGKPIYFPQCNCIDTFMKFSSRRDDVADAHLTHHLMLADTDLNTTHYLLVLDVPLTSEQLRDLDADHQNVKLLRAFTGAEEAHEDFFLYDVKKSS